MSSGGFDEGPRIDVGRVTEEGDYPPTPPASPMAPPPEGGAARGRGSRLPAISLVLALLALALGLWSLLQRPQPETAPPLSAEAIPGGADERVAKLEKDMSQIILRMVTLEKELHALGSKTGSVAKLSELSARLAAIQERLDAMVLEKRVASLAGKKSRPAATRPQARAKPQAKPKAKAAARPAPARKKLVYTVRRGDTLFTVAQRYKVRMSALMKWNRIKRGHLLKVGERLTIYK